jgi:ATP-dependent DNA helicase RecQ
MPGHLVCVAPTGAGKSRIYEEWIATQRPRTLLLGPLVALARQQAESLLARGIPVYGRAPTPRDPPRFPLHREFGAWILSPESLLRPGMLERIRRWRPEFLVMDECHSCWDWGESFRPALRRVLDLVQELEITKSLWLTATLPAPARKLLVAKLPEPLRFQGRFGLPEGLELSIVRVPWPERADALLRWLEARPEPGIVFVATRSGAERVSRFVRGSGRPTLAYHAGLSAEERSTIERRLRQGERSVLVATSAFGMGMHFPQLHWALLWQAPASVLSLAQSIGRVGRGGTRARAAIFWDEDDFRLVEWMVGRSDERGRALTEVREFLMTPCDLTDVLR